jgi:hypothetical protein
MHLVKNRPSKDKQLLNLNLYDCQSYNFGSKADYEQLTKPGGFPDKRLAVAEKQLGCAPHAQTRFFSIDSQNGHRMEASCE